MPGKLTLRGLGSGGHEISLDLKLKGTKTKLGDERTVANCRKPRKR